MPYFISFAIFRFLRKSNWLLLITFKDRAFLFSLSLMKNNIKLFKEKIVHQYLKKISHNLINNILYAQIIIFFIVR